MFHKNNVKYQYGLYTQVGNARPYINDLTFISNMYDLSRYIEEIEKRHHHYRQMFYIDNDFYKNKYTLECGGTYYKFLQRRVLDWEEVKIQECKPRYCNNVINMY